jgi:hypothetical protein
MDISSYLINLSPTLALVDKTMHVSSTGKKLSLEHLNDAYVHVSKENKSELDNKVAKCIFIDYKYGIKGYKLCNLITKKTIYS